MWRRIRQILDNTPEGKDRSPGWYVRWCEKYRLIFKELREQDKLARETELARKSRSQHHFVGWETTMSYTMQAGEVYQLARSLRRDDVFAFPPGVFAPQVVEVDEETAGQMQFAGVLLYLDGQSVAVFTHPDDKNFVLGMVVDPNAEPEVQEETVVESEPPAEEPQSITPEQMTEWGYEENAVCEACGYYIHDHTFDGENLVCIQEAVSA